MKLEELNVVKDSLHGLIRTDGEDLYFIDKKKKSWTVHSKKLQPLALQRLLDEAGVGKPLSVGDKKTLLADIASDPTFYKPLGEAPKNLINCRNGVINLDNGKFQELDSEYDFQFQLDFNYEADSNIAECKIFQRFLKQAFSLSMTAEPGEVLECPSVIRLFEFMGYIISNENRAKKMLIILGPANCGKSQILKLLRLVIGECTSLNLDELSGHTGGRFRTELLSKVSANINDELPARIKGISELKKIIAGEPITVEAKGGRPRTVVNKAKLLFAGNQLPVLGEPDCAGAFSSRLCVVKLLNAPVDNERDVDLFDKLYVERNIIFSLAVDAFINMRNRGPGLCFTPDPVGDALLKEYRQNNESVATFIRSTTHLQPGGFIPINKLFEHYKIFCQNNLLEPCTSVKAFHQQLEVLPEISRICKKRLETGVVSVVYGKIIGQNQEGAGDNGK